MSTKRRPLVVVTCPSKEKLAPTPGAPITGARDSYAVALWEAGMMPVYLPLLPDWSYKGDLKQWVIEVSNSVDGILFTGGENPILKAGETEFQKGIDYCALRNRVEFALLEVALERGQPIYGVCRGMELIIVRTGGTLIHHLPDSKLEPKIRHFTKGPGCWNKIVHRLDLKQGSRTQRCVMSSTLEINSIHHLGATELGENQLDLEVVGRSEDGVIEVYERSASKSFIFGVQGHPEALVRGHIKQRERGKENPNHPGKKWLQTFSLFGRACEAFSKANR